MRRRARCSDTLALRHCLRKLRNATKRSIDRLVQRCAHLAATLSFAVVGRAGVAVGAATFDDVVAVGGGAALVDGALVAPSTATSRVTRLTTVGVNCNSCRSNQSGALSSAQARTVGASVTVSVGSSTDAVARGDESAFGSAGVALTYDR